MKSSLCVFAKTIADRLVALTMGLTEAFKLGHFKSVSTEKKAVSAPSIVQYETVL